MVISVPVLISMEIGHFFAVVKLLKLNPRSIVGDFHVTFGVHPTSHEENDKFITSSLHERNGSVYVNATYGKGPLTSSSPDSFQLQTVFYSDLNLKQTMIWIVKNGNSLKMNIGGHDHEDMTLTLPGTITGNRAGLYISNNAYLSRAGLTTNVYDLPGSTEWKNMFINEKN